MTKPSFTVVSVPKSKSGRQPAPNPYTEHVAAVLELEKGQAIEFAPLDGHSYQMVSRRLRQAAPEDVTIRTKLGKADDGSDLLTVWATPKVKTAHTAPETVPVAAVTPVPESTPTPTPEPAPKTNARKGAAK
jgi:hypothetical protein